jgi:hypothetical protein
MAGLEAVLRITAKDDAGPALTKVKEQIAQLDKSIAVFDKMALSVGKVSKSTDPLLTSINASVRSMNEARTAATELAGGLEKIGAGSETAAGAQRTLGAAIMSTTRMMVAQGTEAVRVAEKIAMSQKKAVRGTREGGVGGGLIAGLAPFVAGEAGIKAIDVGASLEQLKVRVREVSGGDKAESSFAEALAAEVAQKYPIITQAKALDTYLELRPNAGNPINQETARRNLMTVSQAQTAAAVIGTEITPEDAQNLLKAVEGSGRAGDPTAVGKMFDSYLKAKQVFGSAISTDKIRDYVQNAKSANFGIGEEEFFWQDIVRMTEGNASRLGNETAQTMQTLLGGHAKMQTAQWLTNLGLADGFTKSGGGNATIKGLHGADTLQLNNIDWVNKYLVPALKTHGYLTESVLKKKEDLLRKDSPGMSEEAIKERAMDAAIADAAMKSGARTTVTDLLTHGAVNAPLINRDVAQMKGASGLSAAADIGQNPVAALKELTGAISNFAATVVSPAVAAAAPLMDQLAKAIANISKTVGEFNKNNPTAAAAEGPAAAAAAGWLTWKGMGVAGRGLMRMLGLGGGAAAGGVAGAEAGAEAGAFGGPLGMLVGAIGAGLAADYIANGDKSYFGRLRSTIFPPAGPGAPLALPAATLASPTGTLFNPPSHLTTLGPGRDVHSPTGEHAYYPPDHPPQVSVSGEAQVEHTVHLDVSLEPGLMATINQIKNSLGFTEPLIGGGSGRMDSDAGPHRGTGGGGIGSM